MTDGIACHRTRTPLDPGCRGLPTSRQGSATDLRLARPRADKARRELRAWHHDMTTGWDVGGSAVADEHGEPGRRGPARHDDPDEAAMRRAIGRFRLATEQAGPGSDVAIKAHAEACAARARWFPRLSGRIAEAALAYARQSEHFELLAGQGRRNQALLEAAKALDLAQTRVDALNRLRDDALRAELTRASMIDAASARGRLRQAGRVQRLPRSCPPATLIPDRSACLVG